MILTEASEVKVKAHPRREWKPEFKKNVIAGCHERLIVLLLGYQMTA
jgi:hypothetical protein